MSELAASSTEMVAAPARAVAAPRAPALGGALQQLKAFTAQPAVAKSLPLIGLIAMLGIAAMIWMAFSSPPSRDLFRGLPDADKAAVVEALKSAGIPYEIDRDTGVLSVGEDDFYQAKMLLAAQGLPKSAPDGDDLISNLPLGASRAVEGERLRGARELDLARTIETIDAVQSAKVHLAVEGPSAFVRDRSAPSASVMLRLAQGRTLSDSQVQAIVHLVASSVPGLSPDGVSVVDQDGHLLSSEGNGGVTEVSERQIAVQARIEDRYRQSLATLLTPLVGQGNFTAEVHADVDFSETQATREGFPKDATVLRSEEGAWTRNGGNSADQAGGVPGALSNQPPPASQVAAAPGGALTPPVPGAPETASGATDGKTTENYNRDFAVGREVSVTKQQIGEVKRLTVAVALRSPDGKPRGKAEMAALESLIKGAIGYDQSRGDVVALTSRSFAPVEEVKPTWWQAGWVSLLARNLTALALAALVIFGFGRPLLRKGSAFMAQRAVAAKAAKTAVRGEIAAAIVDQARHDPDTKVTLDMIEAAPGYEARAALIRNFVRQDPARAALVVRDLIRADTGDGAEKNG